MSTSDDEQEQVDPTGVRRKLPPQGAAGGPHGSSPSKTNYAKVTLGLNNAQIDELITTLGLEGHEDIGRLTFSDHEWASNKTIRDAVAYIGFDAKKIIAQFLSKAAENPADPTVDKMDNYGGVNLYTKNDAKSDLMFFLKVFLERGNNLHKALLRCDDGVAVILRRKASAYGLVTDKVQNRNILGSKSLTLARLAQAFSHCTAALVIKDNIASKLKSKLFPNLPNIMYHTIFPALIPTTVTPATEALKGMAMFLNIEMTHLLADAKQKRKLAIQPLEDQLEQSQMFVEAAMNGSLITDQVRFIILTKARVLTVSQDGIALSDTVKTMAARYDAARANQTKTLSAALMAMENQ